VFGIGVKISFPLASLRATHHPNNFPISATTFLSVFETAKMEEVDRQARSGHSCNPDNFLAILNRFPTAFA